jgi:hypothetical protein
LQGITKTVVSHGEEVDMPLSTRLSGARRATTIRNPITDELIIRENEVFTRRRPPRPLKTWAWTRSRAQPADL